MNRTPMLLALAALASTASAVDLQVASWSAPDLDCYTYPFVGQRSNPSEPVFGTYNAPTFETSFDDRDGQIQLAFDTASKGIPTTLPPESYEIESVTLTMTVGDLTGAPVYDPTYDPASTYPLIGRPATDPDPGRPVPLFGAGFRNGYTGFEFGPSPVPGPPLFGESAEGYGTSVFDPATRHVFATDFDASGVARDVSNNLDEPNQGANEFDVNAFAIGTIPRGAGDAIQIGDAFTFAVNVNDPHIRSYLQQGLADGQLGFVLATLQPAVFDGSGSGDYCRWNLTEAGTGAATLEIVYAIASDECPGDVTTTGASSGSPGFGQPDGVTDLSDLLYFVNVWDADIGSPSPNPSSSADITTTGASEGDPAFGEPDGNVNLSDLLFFVNQWTLGLSECPA